MTITPVLNSDKIEPSAPPVLEENKVAKNNIPDVVEQAVGTFFFDLSNQAEVNIGQGSLFKRQIVKNDYHFGIKHPVSVSEILQSSNEALHILDVGCGSGSAATEWMQNFPEKAKVIGLDARAAKCLNKDHFVKGNGERLNSIPALADKKFHLVVSVGTWRHFVDPKEALIEAYDRLEPRGFLIIDQLVFPGLEKVIDSLIPHLQEKGYKVFAEKIGPGPTLNYFAIQKTDDVLDLPLQYNPQKPLFLKSAQYLPKELDHIVLDGEAGTLRKFLGLPEDLSL